MGAGKKDQDGAIIQLFTDVLSSGNFFSFLSDFQTVCAHCVLTDMCTEPASLLGLYIYLELSWSGAMLFICWCRMRENKRCSGTLIKDTTVAFHFHCPRTRSSTHHIVPWQLWTWFYFNILTGIFGSAEDLQYSRGMVDIWTSMYVIDHSHRDCENRKGENSQNV